MKIATIYSGMTIDNNGKWKELPASLTILDCATGETEFSVHACEPNNGHVKALHNSLRDHGYVEVHAIGLTSSEGSLRLYVWA